MRRIYTSIDLGSNAVKIVVCELFHNKLNLLAATSVKTGGITKGVITSKEEVIHAIKKGINDIEEMIGVRIKKVIAALPSQDIDYTMGIATKHIDGVVRNNDIDEILQASTEGKISADRELITVIPVDFSIDGSIVVKDPKYQEASLLKTRTIVVSTSNERIYSLIEILEEAGLEVVDLSLTTIGDYYCFKNKENSSSIGAVVNIGYETVNIALYNKGLIYKSSVLNMGSRNIDNDIAYMYKISLEDASKIKEKFACANIENASQSDFVECVNNEGKKIKINQFELSQVVMSRLEEILEFSRKELNTLTKSKVNYIILTGGTSNMRGFSKVAERVLGRISITGSIKILGVRNNIYSSALGNIVYFINKLKIKGRDYTMIREDELYYSNRSILDTSNDTMIGKVFGYFFGD